MNTSESEIIKLLNKIKPVEQSVFYDLGCGDANLCVTVASNFVIKKIIGIEADVEKFIQATSKVIEHNLTKRIWLWNEFIEKCEFSDATIVYYSVKPNLDHLECLIDNIKDGCKLITPRIPIPTIKPDFVIMIGEEQFFITEGPLADKKISNENKWAQSIIDGNFQTIDEFYKKYENDKNWISELFNQIKEKP